jgi:alkaline phosphatase D
MFKLSIARFLNRLTFPALPVFALSVAMSATADEFEISPMTSMVLDEAKTVSRIAFGSCAVSTNSQEIFTTIKNTESDLFLFIGDNVYAKTEKDDPQLKSLRASYKQLSESKPFQQLRDTTPLLVTWDDHDYGINDGGGDWDHKFFSQQLYNHVWGITEDDPRANRDGVYFSKITGEAGKRIQFILLDTRFFRSDLQVAVPPTSNGRYAMSDGETQWAWLEQQLNKPADVRVIATSIQVIADGHNWEAWRTLPKERNRFYKLLTDTQANGVVLISGDRHASAIYRQTEQVPYPLWEVTASSLNLPLTQILKKDPEHESGPFRVGVPFYESSFGIIEVDWDRQKLMLQIRDEHDRVVIANTVRIADLKP